MLRTGASGGRFAGAIIVTPGFCLCKRTTTSRVSMDTARYIFGVMVVTFLPPAMVWWFLVHPFIDFWRRRGAGLTLSVTTVVTAGGILALMTVRDSLLMTDFGTSGVATALAVLLIIPASYIAIRRRKLLTFRILAGVPELKNEAQPGAMLSRGIYAKIRHPRYVEIILGTFAYALFANYLGSYLIALATIPVVHIIVLFEERELIARFGTAYEEYAARVPRYVPRRAAPPKP